MNNNILIKGLWAGIIISLTIGNIAIIPIGEINYILMAVVASLTIIILIVALVIIIKPKKDQKTQIQKYKKYSFSNQSLNYPAVVNTQVYSGYNNTTLNDQNIQNNSMEFKDTKIFQLSQDSIFKLPNTENGKNNKVFLQDQMSEDDQIFLKKLPT
jgi:hypothetical protein